jgi:branched-chain amino acid transport system substrate-binding protein
MRQASFLRRTALAALGGLLLAGACATVGVSPAAADDNVIKIGIVSPMTGANARYGAYALHGAQLAAKEINDAGGVLGKQIELDTADSACAPVEGVSATQRLINENQVKFIIGDICSSVTLAMQPVVEDAKVLLLNAASSNPQITYKAGVGGFKWTYRNYPTDEARALMVVKYAAEKRDIRKFAGLSVDSDYGRGAIAFSKKYLPEFNSSLVSEDYYKEGEVDFRSVLSKIKASDAQAILMYGLTDTTPIIGRQMIETGIAGKLPLVGNGDFSIPGNIAAAPEAMEGAIEATAWLPGYDSPGSKKFVADYEAAYGGEEPNNHAYQHWETLHLLAKAITAAKSADGDAVRQALSTGTFDSPMGQITFDDHNQARRPMILVEVNGGKPVIKGTVVGDIKYPEQ